MFRVGSALFGIDVSRVKGIVRFHEVAETEWAQSQERGLAVVHGTTVPVLSLWRQLGAEVPAEMGDARVIIADTVRGRIGLIVDSVTEVMALTENKGVPDGSATGATACPGRGGHVVTLLDLDGAWAA